MAVALRDSIVGYDETGAASLVPTMPTHVSGDLLFVAASGNNTGAELSAAGWTQTAEATNYTANCLTAFYKIAASASETITISDAASDEKIVAIASFSGVDNTTPLDTAFAYTNAVTSSPTHAGLTSTNAGVAIALMGHDAGTRNQGTGPNNGTSSGWTLIEENGHGDGTIPSAPSQGGCGVGLAYKLVAATTASGSHEWALSASDTAYAATIIFAEAASSSTALPLLNAYYG